MRQFDYSFLENGNVPAKFISITNSISSLKTAANERKYRFQKVFTELEKIAKVESVKGSNAIEGIVTTDERIRDIVNGNSAPLNHNEEEIAGYRDCLELIHNNYRSLSFDEETVLLLHKRMLSFTGQAYGGQYKDEDNVIMEIDADGKRRIRFEPLSANETPEAMKQLFLAYREAKDNPYISELLLIPCVILDFLCIHPFKDGNGRMSRLLTLLLLYKAGYDAGRYISFEEEINKNKSLYYSSLEKASLNWTVNKNDYMPFVNNFLVTLVKCYEELDNRFAVVNSEKITKSGRIEATIRNSIIPITKKRICLILPDISSTTVETVLAKLLKEGKIEKIGNTRNTAYRYK